jgi:hypothetical protein
MNPDLWKLAYEATIAAEQARRAYEAALEAAVAATARAVGDVS